MLCIATLTLQAQTAWTAAGSSTLFGSHWDATDTNNDLTPLGNGIWELTKTDCILEKNVKYELKVLKDHSWAEAYPQTNYVFMVEETGDAVIGEKTWTVAGFGAILGKEWDPETTENDMIKQEDNVTYILTKTNLTIAQGGYKYKICANHSWAENYGDDNDPEGNASIYIAADGIYDVTFTFNSVTKEVSATAVRTDTDGISQIAGDVKAKSVVFNLQGHRVSTPKQGIYIINGKKVVVK